MEDALRRSEARYRALFESIDEGFCIVEVFFDEHGHAADYRFLEINPAFEDQTGLHRAEGKLMRELEPAHEEHWFERYGRIARTGQPERFVDEAKNLDGRWYDVYAFRVGPPEERKVGILFRDISERRRMEEQLREADRLKDEFLAILGHELRNPLAPLQTGLDLLEQTGSRPEALGRVVPMMRRQLSHLVRLVDDLLDISRVTRGRITLQQGTLDVEVAVQAAVEQVRSLISERGHQLDLHLSDDPLQVHGDPERLTQVVANLLSNAVRYSDAGATITVTTRRHGDQAVVSVRDTGIGIARADMSRLFRMFSQISNHSDRHGGGGLGIGLALSYELVKMHSGVIEARSEGIGRGSEFLVRLPVSNRAPNDSGGAPGPYSSYAAARILVVDDNVDAADSLRMLLEANGHSVASAYDGYTALEEIEQFRPDFLLLDLGLPGLDGVEVARRARAMPSGAEMRIIAVTGWGMDENKARTREAGFDEHLTKPIDARQLHTVLENLSRGA